MHITCFGDKALKPCIDVLFGQSVGHSGFIAVFISLVIGIFVGSVAGYFGGGQSASTVHQSSVDKYAFPTDTRTTSTLSGTEYRGTGVANTGVAGYLTDGINGVWNKFAFPTDTRTTLTASGGLDGTSAFSHDQNAAYYSPVGFSIFNIHKWVYSTDTRSTISQIFAYTANGAMAAGN